MNGRPTPAEADPYYFTYIDAVAGEEIIAILEASGNDSISFLGGISDAASLHRYAPGKWSMREVLNHVTDTERAFAFRALWFARGFETPLASYDQNVAAAGAEADKVRWQAHVEEFQRVRLSTISFFQNLPPAAWMRTGIASDKRFTVRALAFIIAGHAIHHFNVLRERYL